MSTVEAKRACKKDGSKVRKHVLEILHKPDIRLTLHATVVLYCLLGSHETSNAQFLLRAPHPHARCAQTRHMARRELHLLPSSTFKTSGVMVYFVTGLDVHGKKEIIMRM